MSSAISILKDKIIVVLARNSVDIIDTYMSNVEILAMVYYNCSKNGYDETK